MSKSTFIHPSTLPASPLLLDPNRLALSSPSLITDKIWSGFIEHVGRGIYGGIVDDPKHPSPEKFLIKQDKVIGNEKDGLGKGRLGWRKDVIQILGKEGELEMPVLRWPGGNFVR